MSKVSYKQWYFWFLLKIQRLAPPASPPSRGMFSASSRPQLPVLWLPGSGTRCPLRSKSVFLTRRGAWSVTRSLKKRDVLKDQDGSCFQKKRGVWCSVEGRKGSLAFLRAWFWTRSRLVLSGGWASNSWFSGAELEHPFSLVPAWPLGW